jgi:hypothetical protein
LGKKNLSIIVKKPPVAATNPTQPKDSQEKKDLRLTSFFFTVSPNAAGALRTGGFVTVFFPSSMN